jgi:hypothetical protein
MGIGAGSDFRMGADGAENVRISGVERTVSRMRGRSGICIVGSGRDICGIRGVSGIFTRGAVGVSGI